MVSQTQSRLTVLTKTGGPGVGKSSTAECVAEYIKKPLYPITCGALGETITEIETRLSHHLSLARRWGCVVLLDEADLFLARRSKESYQRNSIVVHFLRVLDYYSGILIMTTNRVGTIDEGFISRIHLSLYCKSPTTMVLSGKHILKGWFQIRNSATR